MAGAHENRYIRYEPNEVPPPLLAVGAGLQAAAVILAPIVLGVVIVARIAEQPESYAPRVVQLRLLEQARLDVRGKAPADLAELSENFVGNTIVYETQSGSVEVSGMDAERFMQTQDSDGVTTSYNGSYGYDAVASDTGRLILNYDNGDVCRANMYFSERRSGWFAWHCTGSSHPAEGAWDGGDWSLVETDDPTSADDDHGNTRESATVIGIPSDTPGELTSGDVDFFGIDVVEAGTLQVYTSGDTDTVGRLLDSGDSPVDSDDDSGTDSNFRIEYEVSSGTYFVRVEGFSSSDTGSYTLHVRLVSE